MEQELIRKIEDKSAIIGIIGLGYVGLPLMLRFVEVGFRVYGFDVDSDKIRVLNDGQSYINHIPSRQIKTAVGDSLFIPTTDFSKAGKVDALIICVPTPLNRHKEPDLSYVISSVDTVLPYLRKGQVLSLESTTYPGTTEEELRPRIEKQDFVVGEDMFLVYSPEREDPGNPAFSTRTIPKVCGGATSACLEVGKALYGQIIDHVVPVSSTSVAEMTKLLENIYRAVNIGLVNELKVVADRMGIDIREVIDAASTKPFGFTPFYPGPGLGGHCIPIDPFYLTWKAREYGIHTRFIELAGEINSGMPEWVVTRTMDSLNDRRKAIRGASILILGIAYKKNVDDMRESPALEIMKLLEKKGAVLSYSDPYVPKFPKLRRYHFDLQSRALTPETLTSVDCVIITTDHDEFDYEMIRANAKTIIDTRGVYRKPADHIVRA